MIYNPTFVNMQEKINIASLGAAHYVNPWEVIRDHLREGDDTFIWTVTISQLPTFMDYVRKYGLEQFLIVRMDKDGQGVTNRNYMNQPKKLKVFVMKGKAGK